MNDIEIFDTLIPENEQLIVKSLLTNEFFPWYYNPQTTYTSSKNRSQFTHTFYKNNKIYSDNFNIILDCFSPYIPEFKSHRINKIKSNLNVAHFNRKIIEPHIDSSSGITYLYYVEDSDGPTRFYKSRWNVKKILPKKGRLVKFPSNMLHTGDVPRKYDRRIVINFVFDE